MCPGKDLFVQLFCEENMVSLTVTNLDIWFEHGKPIEGYSTPARNYRHFKYIKAARKMARGILDRYPAAIVEITRWRGPKLHAKRVKVETWSD